MNAYRRLRNMPREFYIPKDAVAVKDKLSDAVAYLTTGPKSGRPSALGFTGKAQKPAFHFTFRDEQAREAYVTKFFEGRRQSLAFKKEQAAKRKALGRSLKVGDILHTSWGYEQTNVEFFQVTELVGTKMVTVHELAQKREDTMFMQGTCEPIPGKFVGESLRRYDSGTGSVKIDDVRTAWLGGGKHHWSSYH